MTYTRGWLLIMSLCLVPSGCTYYQCGWGDWDDDDDGCERGEDCDGRRHRGADGGGVLHDAGAPEPDGGAIAGCTRDEECASGRLCVEGACRAEEDTCQFDVDCGPGRRCADAACRPQCTADAECPSGTRCADALCLPAVECATDGECDGGERCVDRRCLPRCEERCAHAEDVCGEDGLCRPDASPRPFCTVDAECAEGRRCLNGVCRTPCPSGEDVECFGWDSQFVRCGLSESGLNLCYTHPEWSPECRTRADCGEGQTCIDAICH